MSSLLSISSVPAPRNFSLEEILSAAQIWLGEKAEALELFSRFHRASRTTGRSYVLSLPEILALEGQQHRASLFAEHGLPIGCEAVDQALKSAGLKPTEIGTVVFTSCTCPLIPSLDTEILQRLGFSPSVKRIPMYQQGCAGGVVGMSVADRLSSHGENVLLLSIELCSLLFRLRESSVVHLLGSALFADGAAATVLTPDQGQLRILGSQSHLIPESGHLMGYEIRDDGAHLRLDRDLPSMLQDALPAIVGKFLETLQLKREDFSFWVIHPGGVKILDGIANLLSLRESQYRWSYDILSKVGNLSSATVQFVMADFLNSGEASPGEKTMMIGIGPGLTVELIAFEHE